MEWQLIACPEKNVEKHSEQGYDFVQVDQLAKIDGRVVAVQKLAAESKVTIEEVQQRAPELTRKEARDRLSEKFDVETRVQRLSASLQQAYSLLELSHEAVQQFRDALEIGAELGLPLQANSVDRLLERIGEIHGELSRAIDAGESLGERFGEEGDEASLGARMEQAAAITHRLVATLAKELICPGGAENYQKQ